MQDRLASLREKKARIDARLKALELQERKRKRRDDTRRKIIAGALALEHAETHGEDDPAFAATLARLLNRFVTRPQDRDLFGLPERDSEPANDFQQAAGTQSAGA